MTRLLQGFLHEVSPFDIRAYVGAIALLGLAAILAIVLPAVQAVRIEPVQALRQEESALGVRSHGGSAMSAFTLLVHARR